MLLFAAAALLAAPPETGPKPGAALLQARASVRIVRGVRLRFGEPETAGDIPPPRILTIRTAAGPQPAQVIEFE